MPQVREVPTVYLLQHCHSRVHTNMCIRRDDRGAAVMYLQQLETNAKANLKHPLNEITSAGVAHQLKTFILRR